MLTKKTLETPEFVRYPNGIIIHPSQMKDPHICPITGKVFKAEKGAKQ